MKLWLKKETRIYKYLKLYHYLNRVNCMKHIKIVYISWKITYVQRLFIKWYYLLKQMNIDYRINSLLFILYGNRVLSYGNR